MKYWVIVKIEELGINQLMMFDSKEEMDAEMEHIKMWHPDMEYKQLPTD